MSAVDAPPGLDFAGLAAGEFRARPRAKRLAKLMFVYVLVAAGSAFAVAARHPFRAGAEFALVLPLTCMAVAGLGLAVRRARVHLDATGVRWGWSDIGFRMGPERIRSLTVYRDAIAVQPKRGSTWFLAARDWDRFEDMGQALVNAGLGAKTVDSRAPLRSRLQTYGLALDLLIVGAALVSTLLAFVALA